MGNLYKYVTAEQALATTDRAWELGIRLFDTAPHYGQGLSERRVGDVLREKPRGDYVLSTKAGRLLVPAGHATERHGFHSPMPFDIQYDYSYGGIMRSYEDSIQRLGVDGIDILLVHEFGTMAHREANAGHFRDLVESGYRALNDLRDSGQINAIGLGVNEHEICAQAMQYGDYDCFLLAGRYTLLEQDALDHFLPLCLERNTSLLIGGAYNSGILATGTRGNGIAYYNYAPAPAEIVRRVKAIEAICDKYTVTLAAAALQFPLAHSATSSVIPGIDSPTRVESTIALMNEQIPAEFWQTLKSAGLLHESAPVPGEAA